MDVLESLNNMKKLFKKLKDRIRQEIVDLRNLKDYGVK